MKVTLEPRSFTTGPGPTLWDCRVETPRNGAILMCSGVFDACIAALRITLERIAVGQGSWR